MSKFADLLWLDLEMTGLDPIEDRILEVGVIATDWDFREMATYEGVVRVNPLLVEKKMKPGADPFWDDPENAPTRDALIQQNLDEGRPSEAIEDELLAFVDEHFASDVLLAGNSIHQDRKFLANEFRRLETLLDYRMLDVSAWKVVFRGKYGLKFEKSNHHRALLDVQESIKELQFYLKMTWTDMLDLPQPDGSGIPAQGDLPQPDGSGIPAQGDLPQPDGSGIPGPG